MKPSEKLEVGDKDLQSFIDTVKTLSVYDFSNYSDKSLKRRLSKVLLDSKLTITMLLEKMSDNQNFLEEIVKNCFVIHPSGIPFARKSYPSIRTNLKS